MITQRHYTAIEEIQRLAKSTEGEYSREKLLRRGLTNLYKMKRELGGAKDKQEATTTCQICARAILANTGTIAHHGYKRPEQGWQTESCYGAKKLPYQESRDAIPPYIQSLKNYQINQSERIESLQKKETAFTVQKERRVRNPDTSRHASYFINEKYTEVYERNTPEWNKEKSNRIAEAERQIKSAGIEIERVQQRYNDWKPKTEGEPK